jgi:HPt (histidine-containing phosphotransfer) domain-containing protein
VAEQKRADAEKAHELLRASERTRRDLLAMVSQGIRAPLAGMSDAAAKLEKDNPNDEQVRTIQETSHLIGRMLADAADLTAMESRTLKLDTQVFAPKAQIEQVARLLRHTKLRPGLSLEVDWGNEVPHEMVGDPARLQQILTNIAAYLLTGTERGGIVLQAASSNAYSCEAVRFSVTSTSFEGSAQSSDVFTDEIPLPLAHSLYSEEVLGLNIAKRLIGLMGGRIGVDAAPGFGATIWFTVPKHPGLTLQDESGPEDTGANLVDLARLYMLEDRMGSDAFVAHLQRALEDLRSHWDALSGAASENDRASLTAAARRLADTSNVLGFTYLSEAARQLSLSPPGTEGAAAHIPGLENRLKSAEATLKRIYPRLSA